MTDRQSQGGQQQAVYDLGVDVKEVLSWRAVVLWPPAVGLEPATEGNWGLSAEGFLYTQ